MKALLPPDSTAGTYFMAAFLLRLPADMIDHIIFQDFKDCTKIAEYAEKLYSRRRGNTVAAVNANYEATINTVSGGRRKTSPHDRHREHYLTAGTYFMAAFLLRLPADMIDHIIFQDFKDCTKIAEYADKLYRKRRGNTVAAVNVNYEATINTVSGGCRRETSSHDRHRKHHSPSRPGHSRRKTPGRTKTTVTSATTTLHTATRRGSANPGASGSRETGRPPRTKHSQRRHAASYCTIPKCCRLTLNFPAPTEVPFRAGGVSAAAYRLVYAPFS
jgi:hypothetical protein